MKTGSTNLRISLRLVLFLAAAAAVCMSAPGCGTAENGENNRENDSESCINVDRAEVETEDLEEIIRGIGSIEPFQKVTVLPETGGLLESVHFREGQEVEKGDLLFTIDDAKIRAELKARQAALKEAVANRENARLIYERRQRLYEKNQGTEEARDEARTGYEALKAQVERIEAEIEGIRETLDDTRIRAPFDGIAGEHMADPGQLVDSKTELTSVVQTDRLRLRFSVSEKYSGKIKPGQNVRIKVPAYPDKNFPAEVYYIDPRISQSTRSLNIKARMENPDRLLSPGGYATVELIAGMRENAFVIPEEALIPTREGYMVFKIQNSKAEGQDVETGLRKPGTVEITEGLKKGETIVRAGHMSLNEGDRVCQE
ncbi:MAG: efflux RND transporter periplasmic adaptor subunit [Desulfosalsimonas sp.]